MKTYDLLRILNQYHCTTLMLNTSVCFVQQISMHPISWMHVESICSLCILIFQACPVVVSTRGGTLCFFSIKQKRMLLYAEDECCSSRILKHGCTITDEWCFKHFNKHISHSNMWMYHWDGKRNTAHKSCFGVAYHPPLSHVSGVAELRPMLCLEPSGTNVPLSCRDSESSRKVKQKCSLAGTRSCL
jgi:hypothetical protein